MIDSRSDKRVVVARAADAATYPARAESPFPPSEAYPEWPGAPLASSPNPAYRLVRQALADLGLDRARFGTADWNPIGELVPAGARIVVKPNWVLHANSGSAGTDCLVTHPAVLRAVLDYALKARPAEVVVGDAPIQDCDFGALMKLGFAEVVAHAAGQGCKVRAADFRRAVLVRAPGRMTAIEDLQPLDRYVEADLSGRSLLEPVASDAARFRVSKYDPRRMRRNHAPGTHRYLVAKDVLAADLVINLPKLKTHKKAGVTGALKNLVGINGSKDYLPHHRKGAADRGGDTYERASWLKGAAEAVLDFANLRRDRPRLYHLCDRLVYVLLVLDMKLGGSGDVEGSWRGNDTIWRTCLDLNRLLLYADAEGRVRDVPQRVELSIVDALVGGEGEGPLRPVPYPVGAIVAAFNPAAADWVGARLLGIDPPSIPIIARAFGLAELPVAAFAPADIECRVNGERMPADKIPAAGGKPAILPCGWRGACRPATTALTPEAEA